MLSISHFSQVCQLSTKTLRFYHSEGLVVPAAVDEQTGYRWYRFDQVERAMLVKVLRAAGMSVKAVRCALDEPDTALRLLHQHRDERQRQRAEEDEATADAEDLLHARPEVRRIEVPEMTVVRAPLIGPMTPPGEDYDWDWAHQAATELLRDVVTTVESAGGTAKGTPWLALAEEPEAPEEQEAAESTTEFPHWLLELPVDLDAATTTLPEDWELRTFPAREELSIFIPGRNTTAKYATALARLISYEMKDGRPDPMNLRILMHEDGNETTAAITRIDSVDSFDPVGLTVARDQL